MKQLLFTLIIAVTGFFVEPIHAQYNINDLDIDGRNTEINQIMDNLAKVGINLDRTAVIKKYQTQNKKVINELKRLLELKVKTQLELGVQEEYEALMGTSINTTSYKSKTQPEYIEHVIRYGDSLISLSRFYYGNTLDWIKIYKYNLHIVNPDKVPIGTVVKIPIK